MSAGCATYSDWAIALAIVAILNGWTYWRIRKHRRETENEPWPRRDEGGGYHHEDGRITRDKEGQQVVGRWKSPDPGAEQ